MGGATYGLSRRAIRVIDRMLDAMAGASCDRKKILAGRIRRMCIALGTPGIVAWNLRIANLVDLS